MGAEVATAETAGMAPGGMPLSEAEWDARVREWFPELADTRLRQMTKPTIEPYHDYTREQLRVRPFRYCHLGSAARISCGRAAAPH